MRLPSLKPIFSLLFVCCCAFVMAQYTVPKKPKILYPVYDETELLTTAEKQKINEKLIRFADSTSTQIEVIIIPTTGGEDINFVAWQFGEQWGIRNKETNNGIVFLIATEDRTISIQQGRDVESYLTASVAGQIIDYIITPNFRQGLWYEGIDRGTTAIMETVQGKFKPIKKDDNGDDGEMLVTFFIIMFIVILFLAAISSKNNRNRNDDDDDVIITRRGRRTYPGGFFSFPPMGGGGFGGSSGGGFGGFGGGGVGGFGGGGASGSW